MSGALSYLQSFDVPPVPYAQQSSFQTPALQAANLWGYETSNFFTAQSAVSNAFNGSNSSTILITPGSCTVDIPKNFILEFDVTITGATGGSTGTMTYVSNFLTQYQFYTDSSSFSEQIYGPEINSFYFLAANSQEQVANMGQLMGIDPVTYGAYYNGAGNGSTGGGVNLVPGNYTFLLPLQTMLTRTKSFLRALSCPLYLQVYFNTAADIFGGTITATLTNLRLHVEGFEFEEGVAKRQIAKIMSKPTISRGIYWKRNIINVGAIVSGTQYTVQVGLPNPGNMSSFWGFLRPAGAVGQNKFIPPDNGLGGSPQGGGCIATLQYLRAGQSIILELAEPFQLLQRFVSGNYLKGQVFSKYDWFVIPFTERIQAASELALNLGQTNVTTSDNLQFVAGASVTTPGVELVSIFAEYAELEFRSGNLFLSVL